MGSKMNVVAEARRESKRMALIVKALRQGK